MKFGEIYIGTGNQARGNFQRWKGEFVYLFTFPTVSFIMERPDNGKVIVEGELGLFHEQKEHLMPIDENTIQTLKAILVEKYGEELEVENEEAVVKESVLELAKVQLEKTKEHIEKLKKLNEDVFSANRETTIRQHEKHLRKLERKVLTAEKKLDEAKEKSSAVKLNLQASIECMENQVMTLLKKQDCK